MFNWSALAWSHPNNNLNEFIDIIYNSIENAKIDINNELNNLNNDIISKINLLKETFTNISKIFKNDNIKWYINSCIVS